MSIWVVMLLGCEKKDLVVTTGSEPEEEEEDTTSEPDPDEDCVVQMLGPDGGIIGTDGVSVVLPADALQQEVEVKLCPVDAPDGYTLHSGAWELREVELSDPVEVELAHDGAAGLALFVPAEDGQPQRCLEQEEGEGERVGPMYRAGTFFVAEDARVQTLYQATGPADLLFVVDNSCSMADQQQQLAQTFQSVFNLLQTLQTDYHIGVTSTDIDGNYNGSKGKLHEVAGQRWIEPATVDPAAIFETMVMMGTIGSGTEKGRGAAYLALEIEADDANAGFLRDEAPLAVIVVSDEPDLTPGNVIDHQEFVDWMLDMEDTKPSVGFHSLVDPTLGTAYTQTTADVGGYFANVSGPDWVPFFEDISSDFGGIFVFDPPASAAPEAWVEPASGEEPYRLPDESVTFEVITQMVAVEAELEPGDLIWLLYLP
jgi:hypothetical protein